jgi:hypothetical protein
VSTSDKLKIYSEMEGDAEFIQPGEKLESGSLVSDVGTNRALQRLSRNSDAILDALQTGRNLVMAGGGDMSWVHGSGVFARTADLILRMTNEIGTASNNVIQSATSITLSAAGTVAYAVLDRETNGANPAIGTSVSMAAYLTLITGDADRLDYQLIAYRDANGLVLWDGRRVKTGESLTGNGFTDTQYGQQTELTTVHDNQWENLNAFLHGGGVISWDLGSETLTWTHDFLITFPSAAGDNTIAGGSQVIESGRVWYAVLDRSPGSSVPVTSEATVDDGSMPANDNTIILAFHNASDGRIYLRDGTALTDGDSRRLGAALSGIEFMYRAYGNAGRVHTLPDIYKVGTGDLMVYLNGIKCKTSTAYWNGAWPTGSLSGALDDGDRYLEVDRGDGWGDKILFLQDGGVAPNHATSTHTIPWIWPTSDDWIEVFLGLHGNSNAPVNSAEAIDSGGTPIAGGPLRGDVKLKEGAGVTLTHDVGDNAIEITALVSAGVASINAAAAGALAGAVTLSEGAGITLTTSSQDVEVACDIVNLVDLADVSSDISDAIAGAESPNSDNPMATVGQVARLEGFDIVRTTSISKIRCSYGRLVMDGETYISDTSTSEVERLVSETLYEGGTPSSSTWYYFYIYPAAVPGNAPRAILSATAPVSGVHPSDSTHLFMASVWVNGATKFTPFEKCGSRVRLFSQGKTLSTPVTYAYASQETITYVKGTDIPDSGVSVVSLLVSMDCDGNGQASFQYGTAAASYLMHQINVASSRLYTVPIEVILDGGDTWYWQITDEGKSAGSFAGVDGVWLSGYTEDRYGTDTGLWS